MVCTPFGELGKGELSVLSTNANVGGSLDAVGCDFESDFADAAFGRIHGHEPPNTWNSLTRAAHDPQVLHRMRGRPFMHLLLEHCGKSSVRHGYAQLCSWIRLLLVDVPWIQQSTGTDRTDRCQQCYLEPQLERELSVWF